MLFVHTFSPCNSIVPTKTDTQGEINLKRQILVEYEDATPEIQAIYDEVMEVTGSPDVFNFLKAFGNCMSSNNAKTPLVGLLTNGHSYKLA